ncbi:MAG: AtpZ/AtpI family protein [Candidatus Gastranaerophilales bacterium]|nr:AtpZ/AtpI family protein [Candidatus Gastranaerophilales bacterium]
MSDIAFSLLIPIVLGFFVGNYIDNKTMSEFPIWTVALTILGIITGMWSIYKQYIAKK